MCNEQALSAATLTQHAGAMEESFSEEQFAKLLGWLDAKGVRMECESCGANDWKPGVIVSPMVVTATAVTNRHFAPSAQIYCDNCGYVRQYAAVMVGLV